MAPRPSAALKVPAGESEVGHLQTRGYLENSPRHVSPLLPASQWPLSLRRDCAGDSVGKFLFAISSFLLLRWVTTASRGRVSRGNAGSSPVPPRRGGGLCPGGDGTLPVAPPAGPLAGRVGAVLVSSAALLFLSGPAGAPLPGAGEAERAASSGLFPER